MDEKHTAAPWERVDTPDYAEIHPAGDRQHSPIALVAKPRDADLIAAAPDLLEALKAAHNLYMFAAAGAFNNGVTDATGTIDEGERRAADIAEQVRAAIAKAEGSDRSALSPSPKD